MTGKPERAEGAGARRRTFSYRGFRFEKAQAGWDVWRGTSRVGWVAIRDHAKPFVDELLEHERPSPE